MEYQFVCKLCNKTFAKSSNNAKYCEKCMSGRKKSNQSLSVSMRDLIDEVNKADKQGLSYGKYKAIKRSGKLID